MRNPTCNDGMAHGCGDALAHVLDCIGRRGTIEITMHKGDLLVSACGIELRHDAWDSGATMDGFTAMVEELHARIHESGVPMRVHD